MLRTHAASRCLRVNMEMPDGGSLNQTAPDAKKKAWKHRLRVETYAAYLTMRDRRTPWYAKALGLLVVGYALSPIDLIPDFVPVLGYLDDAIVLGFGLRLVMALVPPDVRAACRQRASEHLTLLKKYTIAGLVAAGVILLLWAVLAGWLVMWAIRSLQR